MKRLINLSIMLFITTLSSLGQNQYKQSMSSALTLWQEGKSNEASMMMEKIAEEEKSNWLSSYYVSLINTTDSFQEKDKRNVAKKLKKSMKYAKIAKKRGGSLAEIYCIEGLINTVKLIQDPKGKGKTLSPIIIELYRKAAKLEPNNPRPIYLLAEFQINSAKRKGQDCSAFYNAIEKSIQLFNTFKTTEDFYPNWGKERALVLLKTKNINEQI